MFGEDGRNLSSRNTVLTFYSKSKFYRFLLEKKFSSYWNKPIRSLVWFDMHPPDFCQRLRAESSKFCAIRQLFSSSSCLWRKKKKNGWPEFRVICLVQAQCNIHEHRRVLVTQCSLGRHFVTSTQYDTNLMWDYWRSLPLRNGLPLLSAVFSTGQTVSRWQPGDTTCAGP